MSHMKESGHWWMSRVTHMNEPCHIWGSFQLAIHEPRLNESCLMRHVPCEEGMSHMNEICHVPYEEVMSHVKKACPIWMRYVMLQVKKACPIWISRVTYDRVVFIWTSHVTYKCVVFYRNQTCHMSGSLHRHVTCEGVSTDMSHVRESPPCYTPATDVYICVYTVTHEWVMSHVNESCQMWMIHITYEWVLSNTRMRHVAYTWVKSSMNVHVHTWQKRVTWLFYGSCHVCTNYVRRILFIRRCHSS